MLRIRNDFVRGVADALRACADVSVVPFPPAATGLFRVLTGVQPVVPPPDADDPSTGLAVWIASEAELSSFTLWELQDAMFVLSQAAQRPMLVVMQSGPVRLAETLHAAVRGMLQVRVVGDATQAANEILDASRGTVAFGHRGAYFTEFAAASSAAAEVAATALQVARPGRRASDHGVEVTALMDELRQARVEARLRR